MEFKISETLAHPKEAVYLTYRDHLAELVPFLPNVEAIETLEREPTISGVRHVFRWQISAAIPRSVKPFFNEKMMSYLDRNEWYDEASCVDWQFEFGVMPQVVDCHGANYFVEGEVSGTTVVTFSGSLNIHLDKMRGLPRIFHGVTPTVEKYILGHVKPNLLEMARAVGRFLEQEKTQ